ncbi:MULTISPECIES: beta/alpha barrel domain-containing protein [Streptomyces]|uniref:2-nitropropane dioxygenase n=1 Tax=Streptomyces TaxID=1883 RepID=UPI0006995755|nr:2-nitropropane dioxygenase [Streptomyces sp. SID7805]MYU54164.1 nitronate monooxygenase [Streptomyces sp. SID7805]
MPAPRKHPQIIQGGMGVAVSGWRLARTVAGTGQLGVVSGTALDVVLARRLQLGDPGGHIRRALAAFPVPEVAAYALDRYFVDGGVAPGARLRATARLRVDRGEAAELLTVLGNFVEVWLAKEGHDGLVGVNYLEKIQLATAPAMFGAILAGADYVLVGAGIPGQIPTLASKLARAESVTTLVTVDGDEEPLAHTFDPLSGALRQLRPKRLALRRPDVLAIVSLPVLASYLMRDASTRPDGFVIETHRAGGHSAPPRGKPALDGAGEPVYGPKDRPDLAKMAALGMPFWLAGEAAHPQRLAEARRLGAAGVQLGSVFALCEESGLRADLRTELRARARAGTLRVRNDPQASPTAFPFKVAELPGTLSDAAVRAARRPVCDIGHLGTPARAANGALVHRCAAEPIAAYLRKGGRAVDTAGRQCLCNGLLATVGLGQRRPGGTVEPPIVTLGQDLGFLEDLSPDGGPYSAARVVDWMLAGTPTPQRTSGLCRVGPRA